MKVALIQLPHLYRPPTLYPLGLGYIASALSEHEIIPIDLWMCDNWLELVQLRNADVACISVYSTQYPYYKRLVHAITSKYPNMFIIAGGPGATHSYDVLLKKTDTDICVIGEGDVTIRNLLDDWPNTLEVPGIAYVDDDDRIVVNQRKQADINQIPFPNRNIFNIKQYMRNSRREDGLLKGYDSTNIITGRGCPYQCTFCSKTFTHCRLRSIGNLRQEIQMLVDRYHINALEFNDELVMTSRNRMLDICALMREFHLKWGCQGRINIATPDILREMKRSGCIYVGYGVESYTQSILDAMHKQIRVGDIVPVVNATKRAGIRPVIQYMYGYPGENDESNMNTRRFFQYIDQPYIGMTTTPLPGTVLYNLARTSIKTSDNESYLTQIEDGYNNPYPVVNLTVWSNEEFIAKHNSLQQVIDSHYYRRHPVERICRFVTRAYRFTKRKLGL
jgi:anaerobic magnesium-protoporphyrin IX monomethyl ester cyclase